MTPRMAMVLIHADSIDCPRGAAVMAEQQAGRSRTVNLLLRRRLVRLHGGRIVTTRAGIAALRAYGWGRGMGHPR